MTAAERRAIRHAVANYIASEGCGCCQNRDKHTSAKAAMAKLLNVPKYKDGSGYDFYKFRTKRKS